MEAAAFKVPAAQVLWETWIDRKGLPFRRVTSNRERTKYYLWEIIGGRWKTVKTAASPTELRERR